MRFGFIVLLTILLNLPAFASPVFDSPSNNYQNILIEKSRENNLGNDHEWLAMGYYQKNIFGQYESIFDSADFFLSKDGKTDPQAELEATIAGFFSEELLETKDVYGDKQNVQCAFKGRYEWLRRKLNFDAKKLPEQKCANFDKWYSNINPKNAILIFSSSYLNNPASMFGHTFLLITNKEDKQDNRIMSWALNYSAQTKETNGIIFAYKGLFGLYQGTFSLMPYYKMVKKYNNSENRDLWEYDLRLNQDSLRNLLTNLWEINNNSADYYFFTENCSYLLLKLLQRVKPEIKDDKNLAKWVIPSDTVIEVNKYLNINEDAKYRPSRASKIKYIRNIAGDKISNLAYKIAKGYKLTPDEINQIKDLSANDKKLLYDLAYEYVQYIYEKSDELNREEMARISFSVLKERSKISGTTDIAAIAPPKSNPVLAHDSARVSISYKNSNIRKDFFQLDLRPAYHDLMDADSGFLKGAQINVLDLSLNYFKQNDELKLNHFNFASIKSYSPQDLFFRPISWELKVGVENLYIADHDFKTVGMADLGFGVNTDVEFLNSNIALLVNGLAYYGDKIPSHNLAYAIAPKLNIISYLNDFTKINLSFRHNIFANDFSFSEYRFEQDFYLQKNLSFKINYQIKDFKNYRSDREIGAGVSYYF